MSLTENGYRKLMTYQRLESRSFVNSPARKVELKKDKGEG
jgi:hypothetical protein